jgi:hypothetical protein
MRHGTEQQQNPSQKEKIVAATPSAPTPQSLSELENRHCKRNPYLH